MADSQPDLATRPEDATQMECARAPDLRVEVLSSSEEVIQPRSTQLLHRDASELESQRKEPASSDGQHVNLGSSSQTPLPSTQPAQEVVQPRRDDGESTTVETQRLLSDDDLRHGDEYNSPSAANLSGPGNRRDPGNPTTEDLVTLPLATLQQLVQYCAQLVNESKSLKTRAPDLERDGNHNTEPALGNQAYADANASKPPNIFNLDEDELEILSEDTLNLTEEIWNEVVPWQLQDVPVLSDEMIEQEEPMLARCRTIDEIGIIFQEPSRGQENLKSATLYIRWLIFILEDNERIFGKLEVPHFNYGVMVVLLTGLKHGRLTIGSIIHRCYQVQALAKPIDLEPKSYLDHTLTVIVTFLYLNTTFSFGSKFQPEGGLLWGKNILKTLFTRRKSVEEVLGLSLAQLCRLIHIVKELDEKKKPLEVAQGTHFRTKDLTIESLRVIGGLSIRWTPFLEDHLLLDVNNRILYVVWHRPWLGGSLSCHLNKMLISFLSPEYLDAPKNISLNALSLVLGIESSWAIVFTGGSRNARKNLAVYNELRPPSWASGDSSDYQKKRHLEQRKTFSGIDTSLVLTSYSAFGIFENRIRQLVFYMDKQKPQGIRQLWRDKRDTLNYYTFWGVIIFGGLSVFLALFSLAVSIAQTVAGYRALNLGPSPPAPSR